MKNLQEDNIVLKQKVNILEEEKKTLKAQAEKYERRAKYTIEKFHEIKAKEMQLIAVGEQKMVGEVHLTEQKYRKKLDKLKEKVTQLEKDNCELKIKALETNNAKRFRLESEKNQKKVKLLEDKIQILL